jgi:DNA polymerase-3 subunit delta
MSDDFYQFIDWSSVSPPFVGVFHGKESFFKEREVQNAKKELDEYDVNEMTLDDSAQSVADVRNALSTENIFIDQDSLLIFHDADRLKNEEVLENYCDDPSSSRIVLLMSRHKSRIKKWMRNLDANVVKECEEIESYNMADWIKEYSRSRGYRMKKRYAQAIVENVGSNLFAVTNELEKIFVYAGKSNSIEKDHITSMLYQHSEMSQFDIVEEWAKQNTDKALHLMSVHYDNSSRDPTLKILASFLHHVENLIYIRSALDNHQSKSDIQSHVGKPSFIMKKLYQQAGCWNLSELENAYWHLCDIDVSVKTGSPGRLLMEDFVLSDFSE